jgi:hypothetical protein
LHSLAENAKTRSRISAKTFMPIYVSSFSSQVKHRHLIGVDVEVPISVVNHLAVVRMITLMTI